MPPGRPKKALSTEQGVAPSATTKIEYFIRYVRIKVPDSYYPAFQLERLGLVNNKIVSRELLWQPDMLQMTMARATDALDPEGALLLDPVLAEVQADESAA